MSWSVRVSSILFDLEEETGVGGLLSVLICLLETEVLDFNFLILLLLCFLCGVRGVDVEDEVAVIEFECLFVFEDSGLSDEMSSPYSHRQIFAQSTSLNFEFSSSENEADC